MRVFLLMLLCCAFGLQSNAQLTTAKLFTHHMVLQRNQPIPVWGRGDSKAKVNVKINGQSVSANVDDAGNWKAVLNPMKEGGPYTMEITSGKSKINYTDIMLGEVWLCSGQSNMELVLRNAYGYRKERQAAAQTPVRQFFVQKKMSLQPETDLQAGQWVKADTNTVGDFTAVGYYFAKKLAKELNVTVGLIHSSWGGSQVECWLSKDAMLSYPDLQNVAQNLPANWDEVNRRVEEQLKDAAYNKKPVVTYTAGELAKQQPAFFDAWLQGGAPGAWEWQGKLGGYRGQGFMQRTLTLDSSYTKDRSTLRLGTTDADLAVYINGKLITQGVLSNAQVDLPSGTWKNGSNSLLVNLRSQQKSPEWFGVGINGDGNDVYVRFADTTLSLSDYKWRAMPDLSKPYHFEVMPNQTTTTLYNGMIAPLLPYALAGVIWYQGEANTARAAQYRQTFPLMINDWRKKWNREMPFLFVQLASFGGMQSSNQGSEWAELREAQTMALQLPHTGMAITTDISDPNNIHPKDKMDVGYRLAGNALTSVYHLSGFKESPLFSNADFKDGSAMVSFTNVDNGLLIKDKYNYLKGFELAGADHKFYYAQAAIVNNRVKVWCPQVPQPQAVRYAWTDAPVEANLYNTEGFPVAPFRSDGWKVNTDGKKFE